MDFYDKIPSLKKDKKLNNNDLGKLIGMKGDAFRKAIGRKSLSELEIIEIEKKLFADNKKDDYSEKIPKSNAAIQNTDDETEIFVNKNGIKFFEYPNGTTKMEVVKIPFSAYASYLDVFNDEEKLMNEFSKTIFTVDKVAKGNYKAFDVKGDSMNGGGIYDTPSGAEVLAREIGRHLWLNGFHKTDYGFILLTKNAIYHKDIKTYNKETGTLILSSRNPIDDDFEISINDVYQIFNVIKRTF